MRLVIAFLLPFLTFFTIGRPIAGVVCLIHPDWLAAGDDLGSVCIGPVQK